jgi:hypothetical protein
VDSLLVAADERAAEVDAFEVVFFGLQVGDLADVVTRMRVSKCWPLENGSSSVLLTLSRTADSSKYLQEQTCGRRR